MDITDGRVPDGIREGEEKGKLRSFKVERKTKRGKKQKKKRKKKNEQVMGNLVVHPSKKHSQQL